MISQDVARATPSAGFGYQKHNERGAEYRDSEGTANVFAHDMTRSIKSDNYFSMVTLGSLGIVDLCGRPAVFLLFTSVS